jgi:DNA-directed RNA polymerase specialized sigma subunit
VLAEGFGNISSATPSDAALVILRLLYRDEALPAKPVSDILPLKENRNREIYVRYMAGERAADLAQEFGVSVRRISRIIKRIQLRKDDRKD